MNAPSADDLRFAEIHRLLTAIWSGDATPADVARLERMVLTDPRSRRLYVEYIRESVTLDRWSAGRGESPTAATPGLDEAAVQPTATAIVDAAGLAEASERDDDETDWEPPSEMSVARRWKRRQRGSGFGWMLAAVLIAASVLAMAFLPPAAPPPQHGEQAQWSGASNALLASGDVPTAGVELPAGPITLSQGLAEFGFASGARCLVEAPARFTVVAADRIELAAGKMVVRLAAGANGFAVVTPHGELVDLGTEFGVAVAGGDTQLSVLDGKVQAALPMIEGQAAIRQNIPAGSAIKLDGARRIIEAIPFDSSAFVRFLPEPGLWGEYFDESDLTARVAVRRDAVIDFAETAWGDRPAGVPVAADDVYSERWTGFVYIPTAGEWEFTALSNDGVRLSIGGELWIDAWVRHVDRAYRERKQLAAGWHRLVLEHFQDQHTVAIQLSFRGPNQPQTIIPATHFSTRHPFTGERIAQP